jgi:hypothetical protein
MAAPLTMVEVELTKDGTGDGVGLPVFLGTFSVTFKVTGVVTVARTAAKTVRFPLFIQLWGVCTMTESEMGNNTPLLLNVSTVPLVSVTRTVKAEIPVVEGMLPEMP